MGRVCDFVEIPQSRLATATSRPPAQDIQDTVNPPRGFDQSAMLTSYRVWDYTLAPVPVVIPSSDEIYVTSVVISVSFHQGRAERERIGEIISS